MTSSIISISSEKKSDKRMRQAEESGREKKKKAETGLAYLKPVSSLRTLASSSSEGALLGLREAFLEGFRDECREDAADDWDRVADVVAFTPSKNSLLAAFREVVLPPPRARRRRSIWSSRFREGFSEERRIDGGRRKKRRQEEDSRSSRDVWK